jgi:hypothetical protein
MSGVDVDARFAERMGGISMAAGAGDQRLYLIGSLDLVVVRQATGILRSLMRRGRGPRWSDAEFLRLALGEG